jgi:hypothetical protein
MIVKYNHDVKLRLIEVTCDCGYPIDDGNFTGEVLMVSPPKKVYICEGCGKRHTLLSKNSPGTLQIVDEYGTVLRTL